MIIPHLQRFCLSRLIQILHLGMILAQHIKKRLGNVVNYGGVLFGGILPASAVALRHYEHGVAAPVRRPHEVFYRGGMIRRHGFHGRYGARLRRAAGLAEIELGRGEYGACTFRRVQYGHYVHSTGAVREVGAVKRAVFAEHGPYLAIRTIAAARPAHKVRPCGGGKVVVAPGKRAARRQRKRHKRRQNGAQQPLCVCFGFHIVTFLFFLLVQSASARAFIIQALS